MHLDKTEHEMLNEIYFCVLYVSLALLIEQLIFVNESGHDN